MKRYSYCIGVIAVLTCGIGAHLSGASESDNLVRAVEDRGRSISSARGTAVMVYRESEGVEAFMDRETGVEAGTAPSSAGGVAPGVQRDLIRFEFDGSVAWRLDGVQIDNAGQDWLEVGVSPKLYPELPTFLFAVSEVCDGECHYKFYRPLNEGRIRPYDPANVGVPDPIRFVREWILQQQQLSAVGSIAPDGETTFHYAGDQTTAGILCQKLEARFVSGDNRSYTRRWVAPSLGYSTVRVEHFSFSGGRLYSGYIQTYEDFRELDPGMWAPFWAQRDHYGYSESGMGRGWRWSKGMQVLSLAVNEPPRWIAPLEFPPDAVVHDYRTNTMSEPIEDARHASHDRALALAPDPLGTDEARLATEWVRSFADPTEE